MSEIPAFTPREIAETVDIEVPDGLNTTVREMLAGMFTPGVVCKCGRGNTETSSEFGHAGDCSIRVALRVMHVAYQWTKNNEEAKWLPRVQAVQEILDDSEGVPV